MSTSKVLTTGLAGAIGCDFQSTQNRLLFVEYGGKLSSYSLFPAASVVSSGTGTLNGTWTFDLETGTMGGVAPNPDIWWEQKTAVLRAMVPQGSAQIVNLGVTNFASVTPATLLGLAYSSTPIVGNNDATNKLVVGDVFAVRTNQGNYAKVQILAYGYNLQIQWVTYHFAPAYTVLGTGYNQPEDVKIAADNLHVYITERSGNLLRVSLAAPNRASATVVATGMTAPQQLALDEAHNSAYVVEYAPTGKLWRINLTTGAKTAVISTLTNAVGLAVTPDLQYAYISEQTAGPDQGRVSRFRLSDGVRQSLKTGMTSPFFLTWYDDTYSALLVTERDPANRVDLINVSNGTTQTIASGVPSRPSSTAVTHPGEIFVCCDQVLELIDFTPAFQPAGPLLMGIGFIPFDKITPSGKADTTVDPTYFYQVKDTPFGGTLPLMVNHLRAYNELAAYYRVKVDGIVQMDTWTDEKWNGTHYVPQTTGPVTVAGQPGYYPVHPLSELFLWMNPSLGAMVDSTSLSDGLHTIVLEFINGAGVLLETSTPLTILVDNSHCVAALSAPLLNGHTADPICGFLQYTAKNSDPVVMAFTASHPHGLATFSFSLIKGVNSVPLPPAPPTSGPVSAAASPITATVASLMGACTVAGFAEYLYVAAMANNGWGRQSQYDASAAIAFVLAP